MNNGSIELLPDIIGSLKKKRPLIVTDPGVVKAGIFVRVADILKKSGVDYFVFDEVESDPKVEVVSYALEKVKSSNCDVVIGLGGGSSLDIAKVVAIMAMNPGPISDYFGIGNIPGPGLPTIMIPTTSGTGSEVTPIAVLSDKSQNLKKGIVSDFMYPDVALVDPLLTLTLPPYPTAYTGVDALTHAIEAYTNKYSQPFVDTFALRAIELISENLTIAVTQGDNLEARYNMSLGSLYGGLCLGSVNTAAIHALAYPLGGNYDIPHGVANSLLLPYVIEYNLDSNLERYARIALAMKSADAGMSIEAQAFSCVDHIKALCNTVGIVSRLRDLDIPKDAITDMSASALKVTRLLNNNPKTLVLNDIKTIYENAY